MTTCLQQGSIERSATVRFPLFAHSFLLKTEPVSEITYTPMSKKNSNAPVKSSKEGAVGGPTYRFDSDRGMI